jgi:predicted nucleotidyltransferase
MARAMLTCVILRPVAMIRPPLTRCSRQQLALPLSIAVGRLLAGNQEPMGSSFSTNRGIVRPHEPSRANRSPKDVRRRSPRERSDRTVHISRALGMPRPDSDLDLFIDYDPEAKVPNMFRLMQIEEELSRALGIPVTITMRNALHPLMKESIERDAIRVS